MKAVKNRIFLLGICKLKNILGKKIPRDAVKYIF